MICNYSKIMNVLCFMHQETSYSGNVEYPNACMPIVVLPLQAHTYTTYTSEVWDGKCLNSAGHFQHAKTIRPGRRDVVSTAPAEALLLIPAFLYRQLSNHTFFNAMIFTIESA